MKTKDRPPSTDPSGMTDTNRWVRITRRLDASPDRVYRSWSDPEELVRWFPRRIEGSLNVGARSLLVWEEDRAWWEVTAAEPGRRFIFRWPWLPDDSWVTQVTVAMEPSGKGCRMTLEDGPFDVSRADVFDAYTESLVGWAEAIAQLRAHLDFSVDLRGLER